MSKFGKRLVLRTSRPWPKAPALLERSTGFYSMHRQRNCQEEREPLSTGRYWRGMIIRSLGVWQAVLIQKMSSRPFKPLAHIWLMYLPVLNLPPASKMWTESLPFAKDRKSVVEGKRAIH